MDRICHNGNIVPPSELPAAPQQLLSQNYLYQRIHTFDREALHLTAHLDILRRALERIHGAELSAGERTLREDIARLLDANRFPRQSACVTLRVFPSGIQGESLQPEYLIEADGPLLYPRYALWHTRMMLCTFRGGVPCEGYPTALAWLAGCFGREEARRQGAGVAAREDASGVLLGIGGEPLLAVSGRQVLTTPLSAGATDSVIRRLLLKACRTIGMTVTEYPLTREILLRCDEALTADVQGIVPILGYRDRRYFNTAAVRLSEQINRTEIDDVRRF